MKKIYMKPETAMENVNVEQTIMAGSLNLGENGGSGHVEDGEAAGPALGNEGGSVWDED